MGLHKLSVIVPKNPFIPEESQEKRPCLCALDVDNLMKWWPGNPHFPDRRADKVKTIQRSLDWKRVAQIAAYLLQEDIVDAPEKIDKYFSKIYSPKKNDPGRQWPPKVSRVTVYVKSEFPTFSNILVHVNGAKIVPVNNAKKGKEKPVNLVFDENDKALNFTVIDGQHRINGAYLALQLYREKGHKASWEIPAEVFLDLDKINEPARKQAQIFIDVNFHQKKVDRSLVADLFPTARSERESLDHKERAQDIGRKLMLDIGPLVGMIQIPGIRYGVQDVITLATLNGAIENVLETMESCDIKGMEMQTEFLSQCLEAWLQASGRFENPLSKKDPSLDSENVVYQGRVLVSVITLIPSIIYKLKLESIQFVSEKAQNFLTNWFKKVIKNANLFDGNLFISKNKFKERKYLGSGGIGRFRDLLWAAMGSEKKIPKNFTPIKISEYAQKYRAMVLSKIGG